MTESQTIKQAKKGDKAAMGRIITQYEGLVVQLSTQYAKSRCMDFEDCKQTAYLAIMTAVKMYDPARGKLINLLWRSILNALRRMYQFERGESHSNTDTSEIDESSPLDGVQAADLHYMLKVCMGEEKYQMLLLYTEQQSCRAVAKMIGCSVNKVYGVRREAQTLLRETGYVYKDGRTII